jgi:hypothetical protein
MINFSNLLFYQKAVIIISLLLILRTVIYVALKKKSVRELIISIIFWSLISFVAINLGLIDELAKLTGFQLGINALLVFSVISLGLISIKLYLKIDKMDQTMTKIIRKESLKELEKDKKR